MDNNTSNIFTKTVPVPFTADELTELEDYAKAQGVPVHVLLRILIKRELLTKEPSP